MAYQALYRQWRPKDFSQMVGQEAIVETLRNQVMIGRIAHAYLFCGSRGTGKTSTAKILARAINCENPQNGNPCGECPVCKRMAGDESLDIMEIDAASNNGVDNVRELRDSVQYPPQFGKYKVYIIDEVHMLSTAAFNALLKTLEEPPAYVVFILATTEPQKLPATILSRCQRFDFGRIPASQIQGRLKEAADGAGRKASPGALMLIARAAEGGMRDALSILDMCMGYTGDITEELVRSVLGTSDRDFLFRFGHALADQRPEQVIGMIDEMIRSGKDPLIFTKDVSWHIRALLLARCIGKDLCDVLEMTEEDALDYIRESECFTASRLMDILDEFMKLETDLRYAATPRIALESTSLKCCLRTEALDTLAVNDRISELENKLNSLQDQIASGAVQVVAEKREPEKKEPGAEKKAPAEKKPAQKVLTPTGRSADEIWKTAMDVLKRTDPGAYTPMTLGTYLGSEDGVTFRWQAPMGMEILAIQLNKEDKNARIANALTEAAGVPCTFVALDMKTEIKKKQDDSDEAFVGSLGQVFGRESVTVVDDL